MLFKKTYIHIHTYYTTLSILVQVETGSGKVSFICFSIWKLSTHILRTCKFRGGPSENVLFQRAEKTEIVSVETEQASGKGTLQCGLGTYQMPSYLGFSLRYQLERLRGIRRWQEWQNKSQGDEESL